MGEYFKPVNLDKKEYIHPHTLGCGLKLGEILGTQTLGCALTYLLAGRWKGDRVSIIGDYRDEDLYSEVRDSFTDITPSIISAIEENLGGTFQGDGWRQFVRKEE